MGDLHELPEPEGSLLCTVQLWRRPGGKVVSRLVTMEAGLIETTGDNVAERVMIVADWMHEGAQDMHAQSEQWLRELGGDQP